MKGHEYRNPDHRDPLDGLPDISLLDERIMIRARRQRAEEMGKLIRAAGAKVSAAVAGIVRWLSRAKVARRSFG